MGNPPFEDVFPMENGGLIIAILVYQRVDLINGGFSVALLSFNPKTSQNWAHMWCFFSTYFSYSHIKDDTCWDIGMLFCVDAATDSDPQIFPYLRSDEKVFLPIHEWCLFI